jgi:hypothetical protein
MSKMIRKFAVLAVLGAVFMAGPALADTVVKKNGVTYVYKGDKPPIVIKKGGQTYIINSDSEKLRDVILRADPDKLRIKRKSDDDDWRRKWHRDMREEDNRNEAAYHTGYATGEALTD